MHLNVWTDVCVFVSRAPKAVATTPAAFHRSSKLSLRADSCSFAILSFRLYCFCKASQSTLNAGSNRSDMLLSCCRLMNLVVKVTFLPNPCICLPTAAKLARISPRLFVREMQTSRPSSSMAEILSRKAERFIECNDIDNDAAFNMTRRDFLGLAVRTACTNLNDVDSSRSPSNSEHCSVSFSILADNGLATSRNVAKNFATGYTACTTGATVLKRATRRRFAA
mmetsp:Transcript_39825/g.58500  ORF Transcript_39825/g.58500 Transcript_39825/m.58500 type:complete len:224 (+) Transcript_39825:131-802(+)